MVKYILVCSSQDMDMQLAKHCSGVGYSEAKEQGRERQTHKSVKEENKQIHIFLWLIWCFNYIEKNRKKLTDFIYTSILSFSWQLVLQFLNEGIETIHIHM